MTLQLLVLKITGNSNEVKKKIESILPNINALTHKEQNETLYKIMQSERLIVIAIMFFIVLISAFNVIAAVSMLIIEKENNIKTFKALGMNRGEIFHIFLKNGMLINFSGLLIGLLVSISLILIQANYSIISIPGLDIPYPVSLEVENILIMMVCAFFVSVFSSYLGALASRKIN